MNFLYQKLHIILVLCSALIYAQDLEKNLEAANIIKAKREFTQAEKLFSDILEKQPNSGKALIGRADCRIELLKIREGQSDLTFYRTLYPPNDNWYLLQGMIYFKINNMQNAQLYMDSALLINPDYQNAHFNLGAIYFQLNELKKAEAEFKSCTNMENDFERSIAYMNWGLVQYYLGKKDEGIKNIQYALSIKKTGVGYYNLGLIVEPGDPKEALKYYTQAIKTDPSYALSYINRGVLFEKSGDTSRALNDWQTVIRNSLNNQHLAYVNIAKIHYNQYRYDSAITNSSEAILRNPKEPLAYYLRGFASFKLNKQDAALEDFKTLIQLDSIRFAEPYAILGKHAIKNAQYLDAYYYYSHAINIDSTDFEYYYFRGIASENNHQYRNAFYDYDKAIKLNKNFPDGHFSHAYILLIAKNYEDAANEYTYIENKFLPKITTQQKATLFKNRGACYYEINQYDKAIKDFSKAIEMNCEKKDMAYFDRGNAKFESGDLDGAEKDYRSALSLNANLSKVYAAMARLNAAKEQYDEALRRISQAITLENTNDYFYLLRSNIHMNMKNYKEALADANKCVEIDSLRPSVYLMLGQIKNNTNDYNSAIKYFTKAIKLDSTYIAGYLERGRTYYTISNYQKAIIDFSSILKINPESPTACYSIGSCYYMLEQYKTSEKYLSQAIALVPNEPAYYYRRARTYEKQGLHVQACKDLNKAYALGLTEVKDLIQSSCQ